MKLFEWWFCVSEYFYFLKIENKTNILNTVKIMILYRYRYRYRPVTVPLPTHYRFRLALPIVHHRDTPVSQSPSPFSTVPHRSPPLPQDFINIQAWNIWGTIKNYFERIYLKLLFENFKPKKMKIFNALNWKKKKTKTKNWSSMFRNLSNLVLTFPILLIGLSAETFVYIRLKQTVLLIQSIIN